MSIKPTRREWLKLSAISAAALAFSSFESKEAAAQNASNKIIKLTSNENPYGFSPKARQAILDSVAEGNRYASPDLVGKLEREIAAREGLKPENVVLGTGSGEVLCMTGAAYGWQNGEVVSPDPTFALLSRYAANFNAKIINVPLDSKHEHDFEAMAKQVSDKTSLVYVCNPNNPTATLAPNAELKQFCRETAKKTAVFADEAYLEYTDDFPRNSMVELIKNGENVIVSRTFSKIYGMAGLRVGYGLARADVAEKIKKFRMTWFNNLTLNAALAAFADQEFVSESKRKNAAVRRAFLTEMNRMNLKSAASEANFVWLNTGESLNDLGDRVKSRNILLGNPRDGWARITIGTSDEMQAFVKALKEIKK